MTDLLKDPIKWFDINCNPVTTQAINNEVSSHFEDLYLQATLFKIEKAYQTIKKNRLGSFSVNFTKISEDEKMLPMIRVKYVKEISIKRNNGKRNEKKDDIAVLDSALHSLIPQDMSVLKKFENIQANERFMVYESIVKEKQWSPEILTVLTQKSTKPLPSIPEKNIRGCVLPEYIISEEMLKNMEDKYNFSEFLLGYCCKSIIDLYKMLTDFFIDNENVSAIRAVMNMPNKKKSILTNYLTQDKTINSVYEGMITEEKNTSALNEIFEIFNHTPFAYFFEKEFVRSFKNSKYHDEKGTIYLAKGLFYSLNEIIWKQGIHIDYEKEQAFKTILAEQVEIMVNNIYEKKSLHKSLEILNKNNTLSRL